LIGECDRKEPLTRPRHKWKHNIKIDLKGTAWKYADWIHLLQDGNEWWTLGLSGSIIDEEFGEQLSNY
jgi:hypothetical protein